MVCSFSPDRRGEPPRRHPRNSAGILRANAYGGFRGLCEADLGGSPRFTERFTDAACWAHLRRDFRDVWTATRSEIARAALDRIGALYDVERQIPGRSPDQCHAIQCHAMRQKVSAPKVAAFEAWSEAQPARIPGKGDLAKAFRHALNRWPSLCLSLEDGRVAIDDDPAARAMRPTGVGRRNRIFDRAHDLAPTPAARSSPAP